MIIKEAKSTLRPPKPSKLISFQENNVRTCDSASRRTLYHFGEDATRDRAR
jgi:hypothetical protein